jgi:hypothetical protein
MPLLQYLHPPEIGLRESSRIDGCAFRPLVAPQRRCAKSARDVAVIERSSTQ